VSLSDNKELSDKLGLLKDSYREVLDATKHQDDKVGRYLTAVSFLIAGAIALGTRTDLVGAAYQLEPAPAKPILLPAYLLSLFLLFIVVSLMFLVTGMGARLHRPGKGTPLNSHLFFLVVADMEEKEEGSWGKLWVGDSGLIGMALVDDYKSEVVNIALRAKQKYNRTILAGGFLQLAALCLVLAATLGFLAKAFPSVVGSSSQAIDWAELLPRLVTAIVVAVFAGFLAFDFAWFEHFDGDSSIHRWSRQFFNRSKQSSFRALLVLAAPLYIVMALARPWGRFHHLGGTFGYYEWPALVELVLVIFAMFTVWKTTKHHLVVTLIGAGFAFVPASFEAIHQLQLGHLVSAGMVVVLLLGLRLYKEPHPTSG
jgi:hypothetical protein